MQPTAPSKGALPHVGRAGFLPGLEGSCCTKVGAGLQGGYRSRSKGSLRAAVSRDQGLSHKSATDQASWSCSRGLKAVH